METTDAIVVVLASIQVPALPCEEAFVRAGLDKEGNEKED
jgi:hypothetical protein